MKIAAWIEVQIENKGSVAVCNYETVIHDPVEIKTRGKLIDVAESVFEHAFL